MSTWTALEQQRIRLNNALNVLIALRMRGSSPNGRLDGLIAAARENLRILSNPSAADSGMIAAAHKRLQSAIKAYTKAIDKVESLPREENRAVWDLVTVTNDYTAETLRPLREAVDAMNTDVDKVLATDMEDARELGRKRIMFSKDLADTVSRSDTATVGQLLWVGETVSLAERTGQLTWNFRNSKPYKSYMNILDRMTGDTPAAQLRYARLLANRELQLTNKLAETYQTLTERYGTDEEGIRKVHEALVVDDNYRAARSYFALKDRMMQTSLAQPLRMAEKKIILPNSRGDVSFLLDGSVEQDLRSTKNGRSALADAGKLDSNSFAGSGMPVDDFSRQLFTLASAFAAEEKRSPSPFNTVAARLFAVAREGLTEGETASPTYLKKLRACYFAAQSYLNTHNPVSKNGLHRLGIVMTVRDLMDQRLKEVTSKGRIDEPPADMDAEMAAAARRLANVGTAKIHTEVPARRRDVASFRTNDTLRGFAHKLYSGLVAVEQITIGSLTNIAGGIMRAVRKLKGRTAGEQNARHFDPGHVPGMGENEKFREPEGNKIITDKRRIPLVWEMPIPEDTNQPITLTFEVDQPFEGSDVGSDWRASAVGHAFLTLKYTKTNPATGKPERYKTSFGFYPMYSGPMMYYISGSTGFKMPGVIKPDLHHPAAVGATVNITPQQFNDIVRFTGEYERGGYNIINRNCAQFALDAVKHAGIEIPELKGVKEVDLTNTGIAFGTGIFFADLLVGKAMKTELATREVIDSANKPNTAQYTRIGQGQTNRDDIERCSHTELNMRLKGYAPGETAEVIRGSAGICLHSKKYLGTEETRRTAFEFISKRNKKLADDGFSPESLSSARRDDRRNIFELGSRDFSLYFLKLMEEEAPRMRRMIEKAYSKEDRKELAKPGGVLDQMDELHRRAHEAISGFARTAFHKNTFKDAKHLADSADALRQGVKAINGYIKDLNDIFHDTFRSDPRVNICFQNMVSLAQWLRDDFYTFYERTSSMSDEIIAPESALSDTAAERKFMQKAEQRLFDQSRDVSHAMWNVSHTEISVRLENDKGDSEWFSMRPCEYLATLLAFKDPEDAIRKIASGSDSDMTELNNTMVKALETLQDGHEYTDGELDIVFNRLPKHEIKANAGTMTSSSYQAMALSAILGNGFLGDMNARFQLMLNQRYNDIALTNDFLSREENEKLLDFDYSNVKISELSGNEKAAYEAHIERQSAITAERREKENNFFSLLTDYTEYVRQQLDEKLRTLPTEKKNKLDNVLRIMANDIIKERNIKADDRAGIQDAFKQAKTNLGESLANGYLHNICEKAITTTVLDPNLNEVIPDPYSRWTMHLDASAWLPAFSRSRVRSVHQAGPKTNTVTTQDRSRSNSISSRK